MGPGALRGNDAGRGRPRRIDPQSVLRLALAIADREGLKAVTMRRLAADLGVTPMSLYRHFADKDALLVRISEQIGLEIEARRREHLLGDTADVWDCLRDRLRPPVEVLIGHHQDITQLLQALNSVPASRAFSSEVIDTHEETLGLLRSLGITGLEAAQWVYLLREAVFMLANACRPDPGPTACTGEGNKRVADHWKGIAAAAQEGRPLTALASQAARQSAAEPSLLDRGIDMLIAAIRGRATEIRAGGRDAGEAGPARC
jgi:TetR/AcrR family transcriptional regulator, tetracycline repressor protein